MQWDSSPSAGFTTGTPWLPVAADYTAYNVSAESEDPTSMLTLFRKLLVLRRSSPALSIGEYTDIPSDAPDVFSYMRQHEDDRMLVVLNFSHEPRTFTMATASAAHVAASTVPGRNGEVELANVMLAPDEGLILRL